MGTSETAGTQQEEDTMKYMHELASAMGITVIHVDADLPGEVEQPLVCEWCENEAPTLYPMYCTEVDPTQVDYMVCRHCANKIAGPVFEDDEDGVPF